MVQHTDAEKVIRADTLEIPGLRDDDDGITRSPVGRVKTPFLSAVSWAGFGLHHRKFEASLSLLKENGFEGTLAMRVVYLEYGMQLQKDFII